MKSILYISLFVCFAASLMSATFSADRVKEACSMYIMNKNTTNFNVKFKSEFADIELEGSDIKAVFDDDYSMYNTAVKLDFVTDDVVIKSVVYEYELTKSILVYKATEYIPANTKIENSMVQQISKEVSLDNIEVYNIQMGFVTAKPVYNLQELTKSNVLPDVTVKRGEEVVVIASSGAVTIRGIATALQDGRVGEKIRVKRNDSKKILNGKINESGELVLGE